MPDPVQWVSYLPFHRGYVAVCGEHGTHGALYGSPTPAYLQASATPPTTTTRSAHD